MKRKSEYIDIGFLAMIGISLITAAEHHFFDRSIIPVNTYLGFFCWILVIGYKIRWPEKSMFLVAGLLLLAVFNIIGFSVALVAFGDASPFELGGFYFWVPGINPAFLLFFILYVSLNRTTGKALYKKLFKPNDAEIERNYQKQVNFYYNKFIACPDEEFNEILKMFNDYPVEAENAIEKVRAERNI